jgi:phage shock protein PspC (stress-responsive transcriptional regulator)
MNKVITINLNGIAYQLEEDGYEALRAYLGSAAQRLEGNPDRAEIIADIEQSIGDKFRAMLGVNKTVVVTKEVRDVIADMGPVQDPSGLTDESVPGAQKAETAGAGGAAGAPPSPGEPPGTPKRLYKIRDGAMIGGVCNGIAAYLGIDVAIVRIAFGFMSFMWGTGVLLYILMMIIIPYATTSAEKAAATGIPSTAEEFIRRARAGYYGGMKTFTDKKAYREWKWQFKQDMRRHRREFRREMRQNAEHWGQRWHQYWGPAHPPGGSWFAAPFVGCMMAVVTLVCLLSFASLILTGAVFGIGLPAGVPLWAGLLFLFVFFRILKWPLAAMRHHAYYGHGYIGPFHYLWHSFAWVALLFVCLWFADHHSVAAHDALLRARHEAHNTVNVLRDWWSRQ